MITFLKGNLIEKNPSFLTLDVNDVGYFIKISLHTCSNLPSSGKIHLHTHLIIREDQHTLYGFSSLKERDIFLSLISVNGVGPNMAIMALSCLSPEEISQAIYEKKEEILEKAKGIGKKTAQRIIIELKDKAHFKENFTSTEIKEKNTIQKQALGALITLGYSQNEKKIEELLTKILTKNPSTSLEELVREALKNI